MRKLYGFFLLFALACASCSKPDLHGVVEVGNAFIEAGFIDVDPFGMSQYAVDEALDGVYRDFENDSQDDLAAMRERSVALNVGYRFDETVSLLEDSSAVLLYDITVGPNSQTVYALELTMTLREEIWKVADFRILDAEDYGPSPEEILKMDK